MNAQPPIAEMQRAVQASDASYDGVFFVAVRTTGIFCRPSCPARKPLPKNCEYFPTIRQALFAGYRPCKRCRPLAVNGRPPQWVEHLLAQVEADPTARFTDAGLRSVAVDPARARRYFNQHYGMTFQAYCRGRRMSQAIKQIKSGAGLDEVALGNGYASHSGFREAFAKTFGKPPGRSRDADCVVTTWMESPLGPLVAGATAEGVCLLEFSDRRMLETQFATLRQRFGRSVVPGNHAFLEQFKEELQCYFARTLTAFTVPLVYPGTPFQEAVWAGLREIPYGKTWSYDELARRVGRPGAQRAVGHANGQNRICIVLPCHRVVNKDGRLGGYGGGLWRKQFLLDLEQAPQELAAQP